MIKEGLSKEVAFQGDLGGERTHPCRSIGGNVSGSRDGRGKVWGRNDSGVLKAEQQASVAGSEWGDSSEWHQSHNKRRPRRIFKSSLGVWILS